MLETRSEIRSDPEAPGEFDRQVDRLVDRGYAELAGLPKDEVRRRVAPLRERLGDLTPRSDAARIGFVVVLGGALVPRERAMSLVDLAGRPGFTRMEAEDLARFAPPEGLEPPRGPAYLIADVDTGAGTMNVTPDAAIETILRERRSPLTIDEGIALLIQYPEILKTRNCFSLLGSRRADRRVPALWLSRGSPRLGWCWAGNPHTWLGSASCGQRLGG